MLVSNTEPQQKIAVLFTPQKVKSGLCLTTNSTPVDHCVYLTQTCETSMPVLHGAGNGSSVPQAGACMTLHLLPVNRYLLCDLTDRWALEAEGARA